MHIGAISSIHVAANRTFDFVSQLFIVRAIDTAMTATKLIIVVLVADLNCGAISTFPFNHSISFILSFHPVYGLVMKAYVLSDMLGQQIAGYSASNP